MKKHAHSLNLLKKHLPFLSEKTLLRLLDNSNSQVEIYTDKNNYCTNIFKIFVKDFILNAELLFASNEPDLKILTFKHEISVIILSEDFPIYVFYHDYQIKSLNDFSRYYKYYFQLLKHGLQSMTTDDDDGDITSMSLDFKLHTILNSIESNLDDYLYF